MKCKKCGSENVKYNKDIFIYSVNMRNSDDIYWNEIKDGKWYYKAKEE